MHIREVRGASIWCEVPELGLIEFPPVIQEHFQRYQQTGKKDKEAGGQLFWKYADDGHILVGAITGPRPTDKRTRTGYKADHKQEQFEIDHYYDEGLYLLGDWHTHPEPVASPSSLDIAAIRQIYRSSKNPGPGFLLAIVGTRRLEEGLSLSWCNDCVVPIALVGAAGSKA